VLRDAAVAKRCTRGRRRYRFWLTVLQNVEAGVDALGLPRAETRKRALAAIDRIGLDGFKSAYPRELSGGMRQRVGFARAIVTEPIVLLAASAVASISS
jgi:ABC-type proline/glycine betaine transport system ATPase subunit